MKTKMPALTQTVRPLIRFLLAATIVAVTLTALTSGAQAVVVQNTYRIINAGSADFGFGNHSVGSPVSNATITFDWGTGTGQLRPTVGSRELSTGILFLAPVARVSLSGFETRLMKIST
jgi:hypothetical protein